MKYLCPQFGLTLKHSFRVHHELGQTASEGQACGEPLRESQTNAQARFKTEVERVDSMHTNMLIS
jgi:hypothetical protein